MLCNHPRLIWTPVFGLSLSVAQQNDLQLRLVTLPQSLRRSQVLVFMSRAIWCVSLALLFLWAVPLRDQQHCTSYRIDSHRLLCWMSFQMQHSALFLAWGLHFWCNLAGGCGTLDPPVSGRLLYHCRPLFYQCVSIAVISVLVLLID